MPACFLLKDFIWNFGTFSVKPTGAFVTLGHMVILYWLYQYYPMANDTHSTTQEVYTLTWLCAEVCSGCYPGEKMSTFLFGGNESSAPATSLDCRLLCLGPHYSISWLQKLRKMDHSLSHFSVAAQALHAL